MYNHSMYKYSYMYSSAHTCMGAPCLAAVGGRSRVRRCVGFPSLKNVDDVSYIGLLLRVLIVLI